MGDDDIPDVTTHDIPDVTTYDLPYVTTHDIPDVTTADIRVSQPPLSVPLQGSCYQVIINK